MPTGVAIEPKVRLLSKWHDDKLIFAVKESSLIGARIARISVSFELTMCKFQLWHDRRDPDAQAMFDF